MLCVNQLTRKSRFVLARYALHFILEQLFWSLKCSIHLSFSLQLEDGDIVCFQKSLPVEITDQYRYPDVPSFLEYVHNRQVHPLLFSIQWVYQSIFTGWELWMLNSLSYCCFLYDCLFNILLEMNNVW